MAAPEVIARDHTALEHTALEHTARDHTKREVAAREVTAREVGARMVSALADAAPERARKGARATALALAVAIASGCSGGGGGGGATDVAPPAASTAPLAIEQSSALGLVGTSFTLTALPPAGFGVPAQTLWDLGDGRTLAGGTVVFDYAAPGSYTVEATVESTAGASLSGATLVVVLDPAAPADAFGLPLPLLPGDAGGDGALGLGDGLTVRQHLSALRRIEDPLAFDRADVDLDGALTTADAALIADADLAQAAAPRALAPELAEPGAVVTLFSPLLLDPTPAVRVQFGDAPPRVVPRVALGRVSAFVPLDALAPGAATGSVPVRLWLDAQVAEEFELGLLAPPSAPADPRAALAAGVDAFRGVRAALEQALDALATSGGGDALGLDPAELALLGALVRAADAELATREDAGAALLAAATDAQAATVWRIARANGFGTARAALEQALADLPAGDLGALTDLERICLASRLATVLVDAADGVLAPAVALVAATVEPATTPAEGALLDAQALPSALADAAAATQAVCVLTSAAELVPRLGQRLELVATPGTVVAPGGAITLVPRVPLDGLDLGCRVALDLAAGGTAELDALERLWVARTTRRLLAAQPLLPLFATARGVVPATAEALSAAVEADPAAGLAPGGAVDAVAALAAGACALAPLDAGALALDAAQVDATLEPTIGDVAATPDGSALVYTCPPAGAPFPDDGVRLAVAAAPCGEPLTAEVTLFCGFERDVTITFGDSGFLVDDLFEASIDGQSVLTSDVPVASVSTTVELLPGDYLFELAGLAAPDGVGTYFLVVEGGQLTGGPPLVGSDLSAGVVHTWTLVVPGP